MITFLRAVVVASAFMGPPLASGLYPDAVLTPGAVDPTLPAKRLCSPGFRTGSVRAVTEKEKHEVFKRYGLEAADHSKYEVDHLISLELGGSNDVTNLWPQPYAGVAYTAREKDVVESWLHRQVCGGGMPLKQAQFQISHDWIQVYVACCQGKGQGKK